MKRLNSITVLLLLLVTFNTSAQEVKRDFSLGVGFAPRYIVDNRDFPDGLGDELRVPHLTFNWDYTIVPEAGPGRVTFGWGLGFSYYVGGRTFDLDVSGFPSIPTFSEADIPTLDIGVRSNYVLNPLLNDKIEPYIGILYNYGVSIALNSEDDLSEEIINEGDIAAILGLRYFFSDRSSAFVETNPGYLLFKVGLSFRKLR
ncbi:MAG: hypothetical protein AAF363_12540 [Bacteroidota bacterium]